MMDLALVVALAAGLSIVVKLLRQPLILAYLLAGIVIGWFGFLHIGDHAVFNMFSDMGIMFLLFLVGLEINYSSLKLVGKTTLVLGLGQMIITALLGFGLVNFLGFNLWNALYLSAGLTFSSTIIVVKLLGDRHELNSLYGKISIGILLLQDVVAILLLIMLSGVEKGQSSSPMDFLFTLGVNALLFVAVVMLSRYVFPKIFGKIAARSHELLFLLSLAWVFIMAAFVTKIGLSVEIAGFLAGLALANSSEHFQIASYIRPLRDFFTLIFFVVLGSSFVFSNSEGIWVPVLILSIFVLVVKPLIVMALMGMMGHRRRSGFLSGISLAQVSEFSLVMVAYGLRLGQIDSSTVSILTMTAIVSIVFSGYFSWHADSLYNLFGKYLHIFERSKVKKEYVFEEIPKRQIVLVGYHRTGKSIMNNLKKEQVLVIDFDPTVVNHARHLGLSAILGDISDPEVLLLGHVSSAKLIISTSPDLSDGLRLLNHIKSLNLKKPPLVVVRASDQHEAEHLYRAGAVYVLLPLFSVGNYLGKALNQSDWEKTFATLKRKDLNLIKRINSFSL